MLSPKEAQRQIMHILIGLAMVTLFYFDIIGPWTVFLGLILGILASILSKRVRLPIFGFLIDHIERDEQKEKFPGKGLIFYFIGFLLVMQLFDKEIAMAAMMGLTFGDSISHIVGAQFGQT